MRIVAEHVFWIVRIIRIVQLISGSCISRDSIRSKGYIWYDVLIRSDRRDIYGMMLKVKMVTADGIGILFDGFRYRDMMGLLDMLKSDFLYRFCELVRLSIMHRHTVANFRGHDRWVFRVTPHPASYPTCPSTSRRSPCSSPLMCFGDGR